MSTTTTIAFGWIKDSSSAKFFKPASKAQMLRALSRHWQDSRLGLSAWSDAAAQNVTGGAISAGDAIRYIKRIN